MSFNTEIFDALKGLVGNRVFPKRAPELTPLPYIIYQRAGGQPVNFVDPTLPSKRNARYQVNVWAKTTEEADQLSRQVENILRLRLTLQTSVLGEPVDVSEDDTKLNGTMQDFSFWIDV